MQYRKMPKTGEELSVLGFGCMRLPMKEGRIDEPRAIAQIRHAIERGVNYVDTAWPYHAGESENVLGRALKDGYRERVRVATKLPSWMIKTRADMDHYLNAQLQKLGVERIDYYLLHALNGGNWDQLNSLGVLEFVAAAQRDGRIGNIGFSFHGQLADFKRIVDAHPWVFCQIQYNYLDQEYQAGREGLKYAADRGLGVIVMEPLRGGNLGRATPPAPVAELWNEAPVRRSPAEWALRWLWDQPEVTVILSGMNDETHIEENLAVADSVRAGELTAPELKLVEKVAQKYRELMKVSCTSCGYCLPCPAGVMIPGCFENYNQLHMFGGEQEIKFMYALRLSGELGDGKPGFASQCVECGACLKKCPQQIPIPEVLAKIAEELEGPDLAERIAVAKRMFKIEAKR